MCSAERSHLVPLPNSLRGASINDPLKPSGGDFGVFSWCPGGVYSGETHLPVISILNGKQFEAASDETLLDASLRANLILEHSCKTGRCGTCKSEIVSGKTMRLFDEVGLTATEKASGWILTCARTAVDDVQLAIEDLGNVKLYPAKIHPCRIQSLERLAPDVLKVVFRLPPQMSLDYHAGQYIDVIGGGGIHRSYSVANAPSADRRIELHVRQVPNGAMSHYWFEQAKPNDLLRLRGPLGSFCLRDVAGIDLIFLATGTGMAPIKAMLERLGQRPGLNPNSVHVFWGGRTQTDLYWSFAGAQDTYRYTPVLSRGGAAWTGARGYVQQALLAANIDLKNAAVYACGSPAMIASARSQLLNAGLQSRCFRSDAFVCSG
jgi:CDP-4-dehydro-6-deoxyglucose reductase